MARFVLLSLLQCFASSTPASSPPTSSSSGSTPRASPESTRPASLGLEEYILFPLDEERGYWIRGYIDPLTLVDDTTLEIHDYKTSNRLPTQDAVTSDRQLAFYQMGIEGKWPNIQNVSLVWHYLSFDTEIRSSRTPEQLQQARREALEVILKIETDRHFLPEEGPLCDWCNYQRYCPKRRHLVIVESLSPNEYLEEEGVVLVNQYAELVERKRLLTEDLDAEISKLEDALYAYGQREHLETIAGSDHVARIKTEKKEKYPLRPITDRCSQSQS